MKERLSGQKKRIVIRLFTALFVIVAAAAVIPGGGVNGYGLFGEVRTFTAAQEQQEQEKEALVRTVKAVYPKGVNLFNFWFVLLPVLVCLAAAAYTIKLPEGRTIVTLKVRMDD